MNARMADGTARCAGHIDGQPAGDTNDPCLYCPEPQAEASAIVGGLEIVDSAVGVLLVDEVGITHGITSTTRGARKLRRRLLKRAANAYDPSAMDEAWAKHFHAWN